MSEEFDLDQEGDVINTEKNYRILVEILNVTGQVLIGWTDGRGTHYDILFSYGPVFEAKNIQGGLKQHYLFVSVMRLGAFGFKVGQQSDKVYYREKLGVSGLEFAELINRVRLAL